MSLEDRIESLEKTVANLARDLRALRRVVDGLARERAPASEPAQPGLTIIESETLIVATTAPSTSSADSARESEPEPQYSPAGVHAGIAASRRELEPLTAERRSGIDRRAIDLESLIGRYGTLALASLTILLGAGAFLSWAIAHGKIGPGMRVFLGAVGAAAVAVVGWRLRARGSMRFGSTLLALSLALIHVDAWGAGPYLRLVSSPVALTVAAAASVALAVLAWVNDEEALFSVGVGGALLAPFVTAREPGSVLALLVYGYVVLASGLAALRGRGWRTAAIVATIGCWLYVATASATTPLTLEHNERDYAAVFAIAMAWSAIGLTRGPWGARIAQAALGSLVATLAVEVADRSPARDLLFLAALGTLPAYAAAHISTSLEEGASPKQPLLSAAALPIALGAVAVAAVPDTAMARTLVALAWTAVAVAAAFMHRPGRPAHLMVAGIASGAAILFALEGKAVASCVVLALHAAALSVLLRRERTKLLAVPIASGLVILTTWTFQQLLDRPVYQYTPFLTPPSFAALVMSAAWLVVSWNAYRTAFTDAGPGTIEVRTVVRLAGSVVTFMWGNTELSGAYSADVSTFLLVFYYAVVGVVAISVGRAREIRILRHVGLGLAIFAALKAIAEASSLQIGLRVGSYLLAGLFLLAVAYWYRDREPIPGDRRHTIEGGTATADDAVRSHR